MANRSAKVIPISPSCAELPSIIQAFCRKDGRILCASESLVRRAAGWLPEGYDHPILIGELARSVLMLLGESFAPSAGAGHQRAMIRQICEDLEPDSWFYRSRERPGLHRAMVDALSRLRHWGWTEERLAGVAESGSKLAEIAGFIGFLNDRLRAVGFELVSDRYRRCMELQPQEVPGVRRVLAVLGYNQDPLAVEWLGWLASTGADVSIVVEDHPRFSRRHEGLVVSYEKEHWTHSLFTESLPSKLPIQLKIESMNDVLGECEWTLRSILDLQRHGSVSDEIGIFVRQTDSYAPLLMASAVRLGVQLSISARVPLLTTGFAATVVALLEALAQNDVRRLERVFAGSYFDLSREQQRRVSEAVRAAHRSRERAWQELGAWAETETEEMPWIGKLLKWREKALAEPASWQMWCGRLIELGHQLPFVDEASKKSNPYQLRDIRSQQVMQRSLIEAIDSKPCDLPLFVRRAMLLWEQETVILPGSLTGVRVSSDPVNLVGVKHLFAMGMSEGVFPQRQTEDAILFDSDIQLLNGSAGEPIPTSQDLARQERDLFIRVCSIPSESLTLSYPQSEDDRDNIPAFYLSEIERISAGNVAKRRFAFRDFAPEPEACLAPADLALAESLRSSAVIPVSPRLAEQAALSLVRTEDDSSYSPRELQAVIDCAFRASMRYRLEVAQPLERRLQFVLPDLAERANLAQMTTTEQAAAALWHAFSDWTDRHYAELDAHERELLAAAARRYFAEVVDREFAAREVWPREPSDTQARVDIGQQGLFGQFKIGETQVNLRFTAPFLTETAAGSRIIQFEATEEDRNQHEAPLDRALLALIQQKRSPSTFIEVDAATGKRTLLIADATGRIEHRKNRRKDLVERQLVEGDLRAAFTSAKRQAAEAVQKWRTHDMAPTPGPVCEQCDFGDVCRWSRAYSDEIDVFRNLEDQ
ncbi:MAG: ATP-dependent helicase/deoxyribonuclease subunit B [Fimbriimonadaceae bacterium]|nr:ATP-dependent helicase/deoxyribonuclease subunit B [Fimbriimonadaceae bacterium]